MSSVLTYIELRLVWLVVSLLLLLSMLLYARFFFPKSWREWVASLAAAMALIGVGRFTPEVFPATPPYVVVSLSQEMLPDNEWRVGITFDVTQKCNSVMFTRMFSTDNGDYKVRAVSASGDSLDDRTVAEGLKPGRYTYWRTYTVIPGAFGQYRVLLSPAECDGKWTNSYQFYNTPFDWRTLREKQSSPLVGPARAS